MKVTGALAFATAVAAAPSAAPSPQRGFGKTGGGGGCEYGFVFARGSTEPSPLGILIGPSLQSALRTRLPGIKTFPVGYAASIATNVSTQRTDAASIQKGVEAFQQASSCRVIVAGGYSQGAAVMVRTVSNKLPDTLRVKIAGVALFGSTLNKQYKGVIPNFPSDRAKTWCNSSDGVCGGQLVVNAGHLSYSNKQINEAASWLAGNAAKIT